MLRYLATGRRDYHAKPVRIYTRGVWEFQAVVRGRIAPVFFDRNDRFPRSRTLWLSPPELPHGWTGEANKPASIVVFQFETVPAILRQRASSSGCLRVGLGPGDARRLQTMADQLHGEVRRPNRLSPLRSESACLELTCMVLRDMADRPLSRGEDAAQATVRTCLAWAGEHLGEGVGVEAMAEAAAISPSQLRRVFARAGRGSPHVVLEDLRLERAMDLMRQTDLSLQQIADACGFSAPSVFSRLFGRRTGLTPTRWREKAGMRIGTRVI